MKLPPRTERFVGDTLDEFRFLPAPPGEVGGDPADWEDPPEEEEEESEATANVFCPTGAGGGIDPSCSPGGAGATAAPKAGVVSGAPPALASGLGPSQLTGASHQAPAPEQMLSQMRSSTTHREWTTGRYAKVLDDDGNRDQFHEQQLQELGYNKYPKVVDAAGLDKEAKAGAAILYRGVAKEKFAEDYRSGQLFGGRGIFGNGTYAAYDSPASGTHLPRKNHPDNLALGVADNYTGGGRGVITRMALDRGARVGEHEQVKKEQEKFLGHIDGERKKLGFFWWASGEKREKRKELVKLKKLYEGEFNLGRFASAAGYDAVRRSDEAYVSVLNRGKVSIEANDYRP